MEPPMDDEWYNQVNDILSSMPGSQALQAPLLKPLGTSFFLIKYSALFFH